MVDFALLADFNKDFHKTGSVPSLLETDCNRDDAGATVFAEPLFSQE
jgi:hypothetical protein